QEGGRRPAEDPQSAAAAERRYRGFGCRQADPQLLLSTAESRHSKLTPGVVGCTLASGFAPGLCYRSLSDTHVLEMSVTHEVRAPKGVAWLRYVPPESRRRPLKG